MDTTQDFKLNQNNSFDDFEMKKSENLLSAFFNDCNEEEQKIINEFSQIHGIRANDAVWVFVKLFFKINRENNTLSERITEALMKTFQDFFNQQREKTFISNFFIPLFCMCFGIFFLCLISFIGGAAVAGKGWGHSPVEALLNAPAGWIIPLALVPVGGFALFRGLTEQGKSRLINLITALIIALLVLCVLLQIL
ncbi:MAG: hypothetical protein IJ859_12670 [Synergistaceae bacterium]|nr:hypothetical protein [Synergistaceae bacterium]